MLQNSEKKVRYLQSDTTPLSDDNIQDIINARNSMKHSREEALRSNINILSLSENSNHDANKFDSVFIAWENKIHDTKISKSTNLALEEDVVSDSKVKKTGERKSRTETVRVSDSISSTESSEDVLDLYKRTSSEIEKIRASVML
ncbi:4086_t:CDS:2, partial [Dentiscutata heterogama]